MDETLGDRRAPVVRDKAGTARQGSIEGREWQSLVLAPPPSPASGGQLAASPPLWGAWGERVLSLVLEKSREGGQG